MPADLRRTRGATGEGFAARHLSARGYEILDRNYRTRFGELDLVAADTRCIVFCEVKTRVARGRTGPECGLDAIGHRKRRQVRAMARQWLHDRDAGDRRTRRPGLRFDAIGVTLSPAGELLSLEHVSDAF